jgi:hypothetical protein
MAPDDDNPRDDRTVKELIDAATRAELEKWFSLPSFDQVAEQAESPAPSEDPDVVAVRERRLKAIAAVDPAMVEAHRHRVEVAPESLIQFRELIAVSLDRDIALFDEKMIEGRIADPREIEISEELREDMRECTPQALLRDLHRPELDFDKTFEVVDMAAEQRLDIVAAVAEAMATCWKLATADVSSFREGRALLVELREQRHRSVTDFLETLPNRRVHG